MSIISATNGNTLTTDATITTDLNNPPSGAGGTDPVEPIAAKNVSFEDHQRALSDMHKYKKKASELEREQKTSRDNDLKAKEQWKTYAEQKEKEAQEANSRADLVQKSFVNEKKYGSLKDECMKLGLRDVKDLEFIDLEDLQVETTSTGRIDVLGAKTFAERLKVMKPHWFQAGSVNVNTGTPRIVESNGPVTGKDIYEAEKAFRKSGKPEDQQKYQELHLKFNKQRQR